MREVTKMWIRGIGSSAANDKSEALSSSWNKLSTGKRVNSAADGAAAMAMLEQMGITASSSALAARSASSGVSVAQVADGGMAAISTATARMQELAIQAGDGSLSDENRASLDNEYQQLAQEVDRIAGSTSYNGQNLLSGATSSMQFAVSADGSASGSVAVTTGGISTGSLGLTGTSLTTAAGATTALDALGDAQNAINTRRAELGGSVSRFQYAEASNRAQSVAAQSAASRLGDTDWAEETSNLAKNQILQQSSYFALQAQTSSWASMTKKLLG
jgi:flagellin